MSMFPKDLIPQIGDKADYLPEDYVLKLTKLEAGFLAGIVIQSREEHPQARKLVVKVRGRAAPVVMIDHLIEKLEAIHRETLK